MTARALPPHPNLEQLKRQAKELLRRWKSDSSALAGSRQRPAIQGRPHQTDGDEAVTTDQWTLVVLEIDRDEKRLFVNGSLRHSWNDDFAGVRSRVGIGIRKSGLSVGELKIERL
jgi:hypothetical protein